LYEAALASDNFSACYHKMRKVHSREKMIQMIITSLPTVFWSITSSTVGSLDKSI
jgi:hypothetical protein